MVYSLMLMAGPPAGCAVVAQLDRALDSDSKGQRFESPRPHQKAAVLDGGLFLLLSRGAGQQKSPSPAPKRQSREGLSCFVGGFGGLTGRTRARAGAVNATRGTAEARRMPPKATRRPACAGFRGIPIVIVCGGKNCLGAIKSSRNTRSPLPPNGIGVQACRRSQAACGRLRPSSAQSRGVISSNAKIRPRQQCRYG